MFTEMQPKETHLIFLLFILSTTSCCQHNNRITTRQRVLRTSIGNRGRIHHKTCTKSHSCNTNKGNDGCMNAQGYSLTSLKSKFSSKIEEEIPDNDHIENQLGELSENNKMLTFFIVLGNLLIACVAYYLVQHLIVLQTDLNIVRSWVQNHTHAATRPRPPPIPFNGTLFFEYPGISKIKRRWYKRNLKV